LARIFRDLFSERKELGRLQEDVQALKEHLGEPKYSFDDSLSGRELIELLISLE
jgi:hypothetical protein